jgi:hypothetical protein
MNFTSPFRRPPRSLADLIAGAETFAYQRMRKPGHVHPVFFFISEDGTPGAMFFQNGEFNEAQKAWFADTCRYVAIATGSSACCLVLEVWVGTGHLPPDADPETYEPVVMSSQDPARQEVILIQGEIREGVESHALKIVRYDNGKFANLAVPDVPMFNTDSGWQINGRFTHMLSECVPPPATRAAAKVLLELHGIQYNRLFLK